MRKLRCVLGVQCTVQYSGQYSTQRAMCRRTPVSMSSPAGTVTPLGESLASSYCGSLTPLASSPSGEGGFDSGGFLSTNRGPALIQDHLRCAPARETRLCMTRHHPCSLLLHIVGCCARPLHSADCVESSPLETRTPAGHLS